MVKSSSHKVILGNETEYPSFCWRMLKEIFILSNHLVKNEQQYEKLFSFCHIIPARNWYHTGYRTTFLSDNMYDYYSLWASDWWKDDLNVQWTISLCDSYSNSHQVNNNNLHTFIYIFRALSKDGCCSAHVQMGSYERHHLE